MNKVMTHSIKMALSSGVLLFSLNSLACEYPDNISIPDGNTATKDELIAAQRSVKSYIAEMETYLECIVEEEKLARQAMDSLEPEVEQQREEMLTKKYNAGVDQEKKIEAEWNATVQAYKKRDQ